MVTKAVMVVILVPHNSVMPSGHGKHHQATLLPSQQAPGVTEGHMLPQLQAPLHRPEEGSSGGPGPSDNMHGKCPCQAKRKGNSLPP